MGVSNAQAAGMAGSGTLGGGGIQDLTSSRGGGKTPIARAMNSTVQVNPSGIVALFQQGAQTAQNFYQQGLDYYAGSITYAQQQLQAGYGQANATLQPLSQAGQAAMAEQFKMLGLQPPSATGAYANRLNSITPIAGQTWESLQKQMQAAEQLQDPASRAAAKEQILTTLQSASDPNADAKKQIAALGPRPDAATLENQPFNSPGFGGIIDPSVPANKANLPRGATAQDYNAEIAAHKANVMTQVAQQQQVYDAKVQQINLASTSAQDKNNQLQTLYNDFNQNYSVESQTPYTGQQVSEKLSATPGYQFQLDAGTNAIARQKAATGMLNSGNTGMALVEYGQQLAQNTFTGYMNNLSNISAQGAQATNAIANNQVGYGQSVAQLSTDLGSAIASTYQGIGNTYNTAYANAAQIRNQDAMFNAQLQYSSKQANLGRSAAATMNAVSAAPGMMNAANQAAQFGYATYQNQQQANSFAANTGANTQMSGAWAQPGGAAAAAPQSWKV